MGLFHKTKYRIRKVTLSNGKVEFHCERTGFFRSNVWKLMKYSVLAFDDYIDIDAIYNTLEEAEKFLGLRPENEIHQVKSEIVKMI